MPTSVSPRRRTPFWSGFHDEGHHKFREHFAGAESHYALIGGAACDLIFSEAGLSFRATKDVDMVLCVEVIDAGFSEKFKGFLEGGGYEAAMRGDGKQTFYRFLKPKNADYPAMLELFARRPEALDIPGADQFARIPAEEAIVSLSAILLDPDYFAALKAARRIIDGVAVVDETLLIPFKARAFLDLTARRAAGEAIDGKSILKHRNDVFRLMQLLAPDRRLQLSASIMDDLARFAATIAEEAGFDPRIFGVPLTREEGILLLREIYIL